MTKTFKIITLGCKVNQYESAYINDQFLEAGWVQAKKGQKCDVAVVNTCIVTQKASHQSRQAIRKAIRENPNGMVSAIGCYAQVFPEELARISGIGLIAGNTEKGRLHELLIRGEGAERQQAVIQDFKSNMPFEPLPVKHFPDRTRAFLKIQDGCESYCTYCIVSFARGPYRSLPPDQVVRMLESLSLQGHKEIVLSGIHLGKYGVDLGRRVNLCRLLRLIGKTGFPIRIRLSSIEPNEINDELIGLVASENWLCPHFHIPLQSGDDRTLKRMNRKVRSLEFAALIEKIHAEIPLAAIGVDVMAGFPGEDDVAHENTFSLLKDLPISYFHVFPYSNRPGTAASWFEGQLEVQVIKKRAESLRELGQKKKKAFYHSCLKKQFLVLTEKWHEENEKTLEGMSENYLPVLFPSARDLRNQIIPVRAERIENSRVIGLAV